MHTLTLHLTDTQYGQLIVEAMFEGLSIDAYIKKKMFKTDPGIFTPKKAIRRILEKYEVDDEFELRDIYTDAEWDELERGEKIAFGRNFYTYTSKIAPGIVELKENSGKNGRRAKYIFISKEKGYELLEKKKQQTD